MNTSGSLISRIRTLAEEGRGANAGIAAFALAHLDTLPYLTLAELAERTNTGYATVCRFFKALHLRGFRDLKARLLAEKRIETENREFCSPLDSETITDACQLPERICRFYSDTILDCGRGITPNLIREITETLHRANFIFFVGLGTSAISAQYAYTKFFRIKSSCACDSDIIISKMKAAVMDTQSVLFAISSSGRTKTVLEVARIARANGAKVITLSDFAGSPLSKLADIALSTSVRDSNKYIDTDFPMIQAQITVIDILYAGMYGYLQKDARLDFRKTASAVIPDKDRSR